MASDDFDELDLDEPLPSAVHIEEDDDIENRHGRRDISMAMTQKLYGHQGADAGVSNFDANSYVDPRNKFEEILLEMDVRIAMEDENFEKCVVFGDNLNHEEFTKKLEDKMQKNRDLFDEFSSACNSDSHFLTLYLTPCKSKFGLQDTIFRAFLMIRQSQIKAFDLLLQKLNILAKRTDEADLLLAQTCVAHMRHLNRIFDPLAVFNTIFEFPFRLWSPNVRNDLISALPEIFTELSLQQSTAIRLDQQIAETQNVPELASFQLSIVETLRLLRMDAQTARQLRIHLIHFAPQLDVFCLPSLVAFSLGSLLVQNGVKNEEEETQFHEMLREMAKNLKIEAIKKKTNKSDSVICEVYAHFLRFLQLDKKAWKYITSWINRSKTEKIVKEERASEDTENPPPEEEEVSWLCTFETMLILSLLSSAESCPPTFTSAVNSRILNMSTTNAAKFLKLVELAISFKKFSSTHLPSLIHVARNCLWSPDVGVRKMGVSIWGQLFVGTEKKDRVKVFTELMKHFGQSELECEAVLDVFFKVIKSHVNVILEFSTQVQKCVESIHTLSISNIKRLFRVMLLMSEKGKQFEIDEMINRFLISVSEKEKFLGVLALLMKIQVEMSKKHTEVQEAQVREDIERIEEAVKTSPDLRAAFFDHMRIVLENHKRTEEIRFILEWSEELMRRFKEDFFEENTDESMEDGQRSQMILKPNAGRLMEVVPMLNLIKELLVLKMRWKEDDDDSVRSSYDVCVIKDLSFAFEAAVSLDCEDTRAAKLNHQYFLVQWSRTILNSFLAQSSVDFLTSEQVSKLATRTFYLMMDSEKKLLTILGSSSSVLKEWIVPNLTFERRSNKIFMNTEKKKGKAKKRKSDETVIEPADETVAPEEDVDAKESQSLAVQLKSHFVPLKLRPIVHLLKLAKTKRSCLIYLCDELQTVLDALVKMKKKTPPMLAAKLAAAPQAKIDKLYHGDSVTVWFCVKKAVEQVWNIVELVFDFFSTLPDASQETNPKLEKDLEELGHKSLHLLHTILSGELYGSEEKLSASEKSERRGVLVKIIEKKMNEAENLSNDAENARVEVGKYLVKMAKFAPTPAAAVSILDVFEDLKLDEDDTGVIKKTMAKYALAFLKKDWSKVDEVWSKGTKFTTAVRDILSHYIRLRNESDQLLAIQWILTNKVVQLVPEDDKRKSCVFSQQSDDDLLEKDDQKASFHCINKATFGVIFKTLFSSLNTCIARREMSASAVRTSLVDEEETLASWELASSCFLILCLLLRVNKIRSTAVLTTAVSQGKQFLITVSKKSSFIFLMDNITKGTNFDAICKRVERILSAIQQGNRVLQSIGNYAKTNKCVHLLKKFPELRAESESCLRVIHSAMVKNECLNAFTVGLVKSRSIDGEIITEQRESSVETDEE